MGILDKAKHLFKNEKGEYIDVLTALGGKELHVKALAIGHAIDLIAKTIAKSEIKVYKLNNTGKVKETKDEIYYRLNIRPNPNESGTILIYNTMLKLLKDEKALLITSKAPRKEADYIFLADSFESSKDIMKGKTFFNIKLKDNEGNELALNKTYTTENAVYLTLGNSEIKKCIDDFYKEYNKLLQSATQRFKGSNIRKWRLKIPGGQPTMIDPITRKEITYDEYKKKITEGLLDEDQEAIIMLSEQFDLYRLDKDSEKTSEDYRNMVKDAFNDVAMIFNIPLDVFYGSKTDKSTGTNDFITFAVSSHLEILQDGLNSPALISKEDYIKGERIKLNKFNMKHYDIMDVSGPIDKLKANGFSHNDIEGFLGLEFTDEKWATEHYITKNYAKVKGGEEKNDG